MPTYVYKFVKTGETIEVEQSFADEALTKAVHPRTGRTMAVKKVFTPVGVTFRGDGFYKTDSRASKPSKSAGSSESSSTTSTESSSDSSTNGSKSAGTNGTATKAAPAATTSSD